jgi:hypothetical protein
VRDRGYVGFMSKPPPAFWEDPEGDGVDLAPPVDPDRGEGAPPDDDADSDADVDEAPRPADR